jgi:nucleoid-associated protein YgaU
MQAVDVETEAPATWTIAPGDHLWHVAEQTLSDAWGREPTDAEVAPYWDALVEHNRATLAVPGNPDLVYPGQIFELPAIPPAP